MGNFGLVWRVETLSLITQIPLLITQSFITYHLKIPKLHPKHVRHYNLVRVFILKTQNTHLYVRPTNWALCLLTVRLPTWWKNPRPISPLLFPTSSCGKTGQTQFFWPEAKTGWPVTQPVFFAGQPDPTRTWTIF